MRLIAFDLDDTLYKERDFVASGFAAVAGELAGKYGFDRDEMVAAMGRAPLNPFESLDEYLTNRSVQSGTTVDEDMDSLVGLYRRHRPAIGLDPGVAATMTTLRDRGNRLALITDGRELTQRNKITALGLDALVDERFISISEAVGAEKYHKLPFERMMALNADIDEFVYVGDNPMKDFVWPNRLGWLTIQLKDNGRNAHSQSITLPSDDYRARIVIDRFDRLTDIFK